MEVHSMELHSLNCCLSTRLKLNMNIIFLYTLKIDKSSANAYACYDKYSK